MKSIENSPVPSPINQFLRSHPRPRPFRPFALGSYGAIALACLSATPTASAQAAAPLAVEDRSHAVECLALAVGYEAGFEPLDGQRAVAEVVLNRVRDPHFPKSVCDVVFAGSTRRTGCQFTFTCNGALRRRLPDRIIGNARVVAERALEGGLPRLVGDATHYHADYVSPYWAPTLDRVTKIGAHIFYRQPGVGPRFSALASRLKYAPTPPLHVAPVFSPWGLAPIAGTIARLAP